ncbi:50S ribosomal protein L11 methyltransferase [Thiohalobacter sp. IOR34]|uniref:50S ribosomal protein L11 methyltransferase n=1 Tax=Thiohalobacter sp. IOR34 TaxID=3057176 RepID=UPI0025B20D9A|nr:50S ribosomal protein L11 methyltransferase [Thiohalobacter sp. IOR34]WJW74308.1 50S ribosomal protein L11 methyltransferase [Thiohalobacter sp. IOR34]
MFQSAQVGYDHYYQMLSDRVRMEAFRRAIQRSVRPGDSVVDLGAGTGILGIWALQAGAARVYAIEQTEAIELAREVARVNGVEDRIEFIRANSLEVELPERVDLLVSETLGSFALDENLLRFLPDARDRLLKPEGRLLPNAIRLFVAPAEAPQSYAKLAFWRDRPGGVDFSPAFDLFAGKIMVEPIRPGQLLAAPAELTPVDLATWRGDDYQWRGYLQIRRSGTLHGMAGWFEAALGGETLSTAPDRPATHWKQAFFPFREPIRVVRGDVLDWAVEVSGLGPASDHTRIDYRYRCTQLARETGRVKPGRNDPCPCGSGQKYKRCCGA